MALNLSKLFGRGGETRLEGGKEGLATGGYVLDEHSDQPESIVILDNDGETEVARVAGPIEPLGLDKSSPKLSEFVRAEGGPEGESLYFEDSVRTAREAMGPTGTSQVDVWEHAATAPRPDPVTEDMAEIVLNATGEHDSGSAIVDAADYTVWRANSAPDVPGGTEPTHPDAEMGFQVDQKLGMPDYFTWQENLRSSTPPAGILPYIEQSNLVGDGKFTASEDQLQTLVGRLQERGLFDTSTGEIVWADEATSNFTGSDGELGALIAWLRTTQPGSSESALDAGFTIADDLINEARPGGGYIGETEKNVLSPGDGDDAARSMQPDAHGFTSAEGRSMSFELFSGGGPGPGPESQNLPEVGDEVIVSMLNNKNPELTRYSADIKFDGVDGEAARSMQPGGQGQGFMMQDGELYPRGLLLPYMEQDNLYQGTDDQVTEVIGHLRERGLIDTSTGEIVWADEATANHTGSDEELGALIAWLRGNNLIDTSTGEIVWARQPGASGWYVPDMDSDQSGMAIENGRSMQPGQQGEGFMMQDGELYPRGLRDMEIEMVKGGGGTAEGDGPQGNALFDADSGKGLLTEIGLPGAAGYTATDDLWKVRGDAPGFQAPSYEIEDVTQVRPLSGDFDPSTAIQGATEKIEGPGFAYNLGDTVTYAEGIPGGSLQEWERPDAALEKIEIALAADDGPTTLLGGDAALADPAVPQEQFSLNFTKVEFHGHDAEGSDGDGDGDAFMDYTDDVDL